ncbi:MAG: hypothetical protein WCD79_21765 [Chthoniobacteraceae bacterium]
METPIPSLDITALNPRAASDYKFAHRNRLMVLTTLKSETPGRDAFCHIQSVETLVPNLWVTVNFLDGSRKQFRPEMIRLATEEEQRLSQTLPEEE